MSNVNVVSLGDIANAMAADKQREINNWFIKQRLADSAGPHDSGLTVVRAGLGALLIRAGGWIGGPKVAPRLTRQLAH
jgi:hypothetical protein